MVFNYSIEKILCSSEILDSDMSEELPCVVVVVVVALKSTLSDIFVDVSVVIGFAEIDKNDMSRCMRFPTMWHFDMCRLGRASAASF